MKLTFSTRRSGKSKLNERLVAQQKLTESDVAEIIKLHRKKDRLLDKLENGVDLKLAEEVRQVEYQLQLTWKFTTEEKGFNWNYWRFWVLPFCTCPSMDCEDMFGTGLYYFNENCPYFHGRSLAEN